MIFGGQGDGVTKACPKQAAAEDPLKVNNPSVCSQREEIHTDFRVSGLPHAVVKQAENFRVRELAKKIESHPRRQALQADFKQNNAYNPLGDDSSFCFLKFVVVRSFTADSNLLQPTRCVNSTLTRHESLRKCGMK